jgi:Domain of Unknown Function (DUF1080)
MKRLSVIMVEVLVIGLVAFGCLHAPASQTDTNWITLLDGSNLDHWNRVGNANWRLEDGVVQADKGSGHLVSKNSYTDFQIRAEFWVDPAANSGIFIRCTEPQKISSRNSYEVNIYEKTPRPGLRHRRYVDVAKVSPMPKAGGRWNTLEITAKGPQLTVVFNGARTVKFRTANMLAGRSLFNIPQAS